MALTRKQKQALAEHVYALYEARWKPDASDATHDDLICMESTDDELLDAVTHLGLTDRHLEYVQDFILEDLRTTDWDGWLDDEEEDEE